VLVFSIFLSPAPPAEREKEREENARVETSRTLQQKRETDFRKRERE
jgi:hypothetical protein